MDRIFEAIEEWMRNLLTGMVSSNLTTMYTDVNEKTGHTASTFLVATNSTPVPAQSSTSTWPMVTGASTVRFRTTSITSMIRSFGTSSFVFTEAIKSFP